MNPLLASLSVRAPLSVSLYTYGFLSYFLSNRFKGCFFIFLSVVFHFSFVYLVLAFIASNLVKINVKLSLLLSILFFSISSFVLPSLIPLIPIAQISDQYSNYVTNTAVGEGGEGISAQIVNMILFITVIYFFIAGLVFSPHKDDFFLNKIHSKLLILVPFICLSAFQYLVFYRYSLSVLLIFCIYLLSFIYKYKNNLLFISLGVILVVNLIIVDLYIRKNSLIYGEPITQAFLSPILNIEYTDAEYREVLKYIDKNGLLK